MMAGMQPLDLLSHAAHRADPIQIHAPAQNSYDHGRHQDSDSDGENKAGQKRKRNRLALNCTECRRRKVKCDRNKPCEGCLKRGEPEKCQWDQDVPQQPFALAGNVRQLEARYKALESFVVSKYGTTHPELMAALEAATSASPADYAFTSGLPSSPAMSNSHRNSLKTSRSGAADVEIDDAANVIEDMALSSIKYAQGTASEKGKSGTRRLDLAVGETSIYLEISPVRGPSSTLFPTDTVYRRIREILPPRDVVEFLISGALDDLWQKGNIMPSVYLKEVAQFWAAIDQGVMHDVDPCFIASLLAGLACGYEMLSEDVTHICGRPYTDFQHLVPLWQNAASHVLLLGNWLIIPQFRVLQTILFKWHPCMQEVPNSPIWAGIAVRTAQALNFHKLDDDENIMPSDSPGLPYGACSLKRQIACRVWHSLIFIDCMSSFKAGNFTIRSMADYTTAPPLIVADEDLGTQLHVEPKLVNGKPVICEATYALAKSQFATAMRDFAIGAQTIMQDSTGNAYERIRQIDARFRKELEPLLAANHFDKTMAATMRTGLNYRLSRLHRAFAKIGLVDTRYALSSRTTIECARNILSTLSHIDNRKLWFVVLHALGAVIVEFQHMWLTEDHRSARLLNQAEFQSDIALAIRYFEYNQASRSKLCQWSATQALQSTLGLQQALWNRQNGISPGAHAGFDESFALVLRQVAAESGMSASPWSGHPPAVASAAAAPVPTSIALPTMPSTSSAAAAAANALPFNDDHGFLGMTGTPSAGGPMALPFFDLMGVTEGATTSSDFWAELAKGFVSGDVPMLEGDGDVTMSKAGQQGRSGKGGTGNGGGIDVARFGVDTNIDWGTLLGGTSAPL